MKKVFISSSLLIKGAKDGEPNQERQLLLSLGFSTEELNGLSSGDSKAEDLVKSYTERVENSVKDRIGQQIEATKKSEIFKAVHSKNEKLVCETFGLNYEEFKNLEAQGRLSKILAKVSSTHGSKIEELKSKYSNVDQGKLKEMELAFEQRKKDIVAEYEGKLSEKEKALLDLHASNKKVLLDNFKKSINSKFFSSLQNPAFTPEVMEILINDEVSSYSMEIEEQNGQSIGFLLKDGVKVAHPSNPSKNLTYSDLLEIASEKRGFVKKSKGGDDKTFEIPKGDKDDLKKLGVSDKVIAERQKHIQNLNG